MSQYFDINRKALDALPVQHIDGFARVGGSKWFVAVNSTSFKIEHGHNYLLRDIDRGTDNPPPLRGVYTYFEGKDFVLWANRIPTSPAPKTIYERDDDEEQSCDYFVVGEVVGWYYAERSQDDGAELHAPKGNAE